MGFDAVVAGLGPGGASAAYHLARAGLRVAGFDIAGSYRKACGDASPVSGPAARLAEEAGVVVDEVSTFRVLVGGSEIASINYRKPVWVIMDKGGFVGYLRDLARAEGAVIERRPAPPPGEAGEAMYVEARGPFAGGPGRIIVYRVIARAPSWPVGEALLDFDLDGVGFYWVFPAGPGRVNVGVGWLSCPSCAREARAKTLSYASRVLGRFEVIDERAAPLRIAGPVSATPGRGVAAVGEAAGLVISLSGEGIRPSVESGRLLGEAASSCWPDKACTLARYKRLAGRLEGAARLSRRLLSLVARSSPKAGEGLLRSLPAGFWRDFIAGRMDYGLVVGAAARRPVLTARLVRLLLSSRS